MKTLRTILTALFLLSIIALSAQEKDIVFEKITNESGRSLGFITGIAQDQTGFMWFATRGGLYRYNGYSYKLFRNIPNDSLSLPYNDIAYLYLDNDQNFWMRHYDEISVFKNEKQLHTYDTLMHLNYDIEVKVVQDKYGNYWIGPTSKGLMKYDPTNKNIRPFHCPPQTYSSQAWKLYDSELNGSKVVANILNPRPSIDTSVIFTISQKGYYLLASSGEIDNYGKYDYASVYMGNKLIWELSEKNAKHAGGDDKNVFEVFPIELQPGKYTLTYKSDMSHSCGNWDGNGPDRINFCGAAVTEISSALFTDILKNQLQACHDSSYIASEQIKDVLIDNQGNFWALTETGIEKYNYKKQLFEHFEIPFNTLLKNDIEGSFLNIYQDKQGIFWIGSDYGLIQYDHLWGKFSVFQNTETKKMLTGNSIYSIFEDRNNQLWIGTNAGINIFDRKLNTIQKITANNHNQLYDNRIIDIFEDKGGNIWVATFEGLNRLIKSQFTFTPLNINADIAYPAEYDDEANIWIAINNTILKYATRQLSKQTFKLPNSIFSIDAFTGEANYVVNHMVMENNQYAWVATDNKISRYNLLTKKIDYTKTLGAIIVGTDSIKNSIKQFVKGKSNKLYALSSIGLYVMNLTNLTYEGFYGFNQSYEFIEDVDGNFFKNAQIDKNGTVWIRTSVGMYQFNPQLKQMALIFEFDDRFKSGSISDGKFDFDKYGNIWLATLPVLNRINNENHKIDQWNCSYDHDWGLSNVKVNNETIYIYGSNGLYTFNQAETSFEYASVETGFIDNNINGIEFDSRGYIWLTSLKGLIKYDPEEKKSKNYFTNADYTTHRFLGNPSQFKISSAEKILFTTNGFVSFYPDSINNAIPPVVIDKFTIRGKDYDMDSLIYYKKSINLNYKQNFINIEFAVLDYTEPSENRYKYKLEGLEDEWNIADANNRKIPYSGLAPGKYTFRVLGANNDKVWNENGASIQIIISPPWYKTILAYIIYTILAIASVWIFIKVREKNLIEEKRILEHKVYERTAEIEAQKEKLAEQNLEITKQKDDITASIHYAQRIQTAILPPVAQIEEVVDEFFILYRPRDIVSGDYYWTTRKGDISIIVAADCTGHGVPGAFMSMLGIAFLNEIVNKEEIIEPNEILNRLRNQVVTQLHQTGEEGESKDGMDISLYVINHKTNMLKFSGAYNPLYIIRDNEVIQLKADRMPIGYYIKMDQPFSFEEIELKKGDCLYNSSDGYPDQFGGEDGRKFMTKRFKELLIEIHKKPMTEQHAILDKTIDEWRGGIEQIDDIIVIGVRI